MNAIIEDAIVRVEQLYVTLTGNRPPPIEGKGVVIPPEVDPLVHLEEQLGRMVSGVEELFAVPKPEPTWTPRAIAWRFDGGIAFALDVPGASREGLAVRVSGKTIAITGQRQPPWKGTPPASVDGCEVQLGAFARMFTLATPVEPSHVGAELEDGVLTIRVGDTPRTGPSQIPITS